MSREIQQTELLRRTTEGRLLDVRTSMAAEVVSFDANTMTASIRPGVRVQAVDADSPPEVDELSVLDGVPVEFPHFGPFILYNPLSPGDVGRLEYSEEDDSEVYDDETVSLPVTPTVLTRHGAAAVFRPGGFRGAGGLNGEPEANGFIGRPGGVGISFTEAAVLLGGSDATDPLVRKSDLQTALDAAVNGHTHDPGTLVANTSTGVITGKTAAGPSHTATGSGVVKAK